MKRKIIEINVILNWDFYKLGLFNNLKFLVIFTRHDSKYQSYTFHSALAHGYSHFLCQQNIGNLRLQCQSLRWNSKFWAASELHCLNTQLIFFFNLERWSEYFQTMKLLPCQKWDFFVYKKNLFLSNMFPNSASCIEKIII